MTELYVVLGAATFFVCALSMVMGYPIYHFSKKDLENKQGAQMGQPLPCSLPKGLKLKEKLLNWEQQFIASRSVFQNQSAQAF